MLHVIHTDWHVDGATLKRRYQYSGLLGKHSKHILQIDIDSSRSSLTGDIDFHVCILVHPNFWPDLGQGYLVAQLAVADKLVEAPFATVTLMPCDDGSLLIGPTDAEGARSFLNTIMECEPMRLLLVNGKETLAELPIPNDPQFRSVANRFFSSL